MAVRSVKAREQKTPVERAATVARPVARPAARARRGAGADGTGTNGAGSNGARPGRSTTTAGGPGRRPSESVDDYLKAIYTLSGTEQRRVGSSELAQRLGVAPASITNMLQKLAAATRPLIDYERGRGVRLSAGGRRRALEVVRHHRLIETFLYEVLGYPIEELHDEAERLEHFISESFEARVAARLHHPTRDPHGHCIPALDGTMPPGHMVNCSCGTP